MNLPQNELHTFDPENPDIRYKAWEDGEYACLRIDYPDASAEIRFKDAGDIIRLFEELPKTMDRASDVLLSLP